MWGHLGPRSRNWGKVETDNHLSLVAYGDSVGRKVSLPLLSRKLEILAPKRCQSIAYCLHQGIFSNKRTHCSFLVNSPTFTIFSLSILGSAGWRVVMVTAPIRASYYQDASDQWPSRRSAWVPPFHFPCSSGAFSDFFSLKKILLLLLLLVLQISPVPSPRFLPLPQPPLTPRPVFTTLLPVIVIMWD